MSSNCEMKQRLCGAFFILVFVQPLFRSCCFCFFVNQKLGRHHDALLTSCLHSVTKVGTKSNGETKRQTTLCFASVSHRSKHLHHTY